MNKSSRFRWVISLPFRLVRRFLNWVLIDPLAEDDNRFRFPGVIFHNRNVSVGKRVFIGPECYFGGKSEITIGHDTMLARRVCVLTNTHDYNKNPIWRTTIFRPVSIGNFVWIGFGAIIFPGVRIGDHAIIGAGSVITGHVPEKAVVVGNPARIIRYRDIPELDTELQNKFPYWEDVFEDYLPPKKVTKTHNI